MINSLDTLGLRVETINPESFKTKVNINSEISVLFNSDLDVSTVINNFIILKDSNLKYDSGEIELSDFEIVDGNVTYKDKTIVFSPFNQLDTNCRYIIYIVKNRIRDVLGNVMLVDYVSYFSTESHASLGECEILEPENNKTLSVLDRISLTSLDTDKYLIQISKIKTFDNLVIEKTIDTSTLEEDLKLGDGLYYIRAKALNGAFGEPSVVTIRTNSNSVPTDQDLDESYIWQEYENDELKLLENLPSGIDVNEKTNILYMKFNKVLDINDIDFYESFITGESNDDDNSEISHGELEGSYIVVNDDEKSESYVFFVPNSL